MPESYQESGPLGDEVALHYAGGYEARRLRGPGGQLELRRTQELTARYLPPPPAVIYDVGGGPGIYAYWLASRGYTVHLIDALPLHVELAQAAGRDHLDAPLASIAVGDARRLDRPDERADAALLFGPLYHLTDRADRITALAEARRVVRPGGVVLAVAISRFASVFDGIYRGMLADDEALPIVRDDLATGQHRNPTNHPGYFTTAFFHHPSELQDELEAAGLRHEATLAIEGPAWQSEELRAAWDDPVRHAYVERVMETLRRVEAEPTLLGASAHLMAVGRRVGA
jgi:SAM-dependent methyltransferase